MQTALFLCFTQFFQTKYRDTALQVVADEFKPNLTQYFSLPFIDNPYKCIRRNTAFQAEHHHLVSLLANYVWHDFDFFVIDTRELSKTFQDIGLQ